MPKDFMPEIADPVHRLQLLRDNCDDSEETTYYKELSNDELDIKREELTQNLITIGQEDDLLDEARKKNKIVTKPLKDSNKHLLSEIRTRKSEVIGTIFHIADHDNGVMESFNELGEFVSSRRLKPEEKQKKLFNVPKTGTDDE